MKYKVVIRKKNGTFPIKGLNKLLAGHMKNPRTGKYHNPIKSENDKICRDAINRYIKGVQLRIPIRCTYYIYAADKRHDRQNLYSVDKSFLDALQATGHIHNDGWKETVDSVFHTMVDNSNPRIEVIIEEV